MNQEYVIIGLVCLGALLFSLGGTINKALRRFLLPLILASGGLLLGLAWWRCLIALPLMIGALCLGYGENHPLWKKALTILALGACLLPLASGANALLTLIIPAVFGTNYWLSRRFNWYSWKLVELACGGALGGVVTLLALTQGG